MGGLLQNDISYDEHYSIMSDKHPIPLWAYVILAAILLRLINYFGAVNNLAYILITAGCLILGFLLGVFLQGTEAPDDAKGFGVKLLFLGFVLLMLYFIG